MSRSLFLECGSGISGDMFVATMLDLGADRDNLLNVLDSIPLDGFRVEITDVFKSGIRCCDFNVILDEDIDGHDHDMDFLHGEDDRNHAHSHSHSHGDSIDGEHHHSHHHVHRHLSDVIRIIDSTKMSFDAKQLAKDIFYIIADAESKAHGISVDEVHFHEVGAVDSIVDIISAAVVFTDLGFDEVIIPGITEGTGTIRCAHGLLNVPVPAVLNIVSNSNLILRITDNSGEFVTPTGAAIAAAIRTSDKLPSKFRVIKTGYGAGKRTYKLPSILRSLEIEYESDSNIDYIYRLETDIDDSTGEDLGYVMEKLYEAGAREVHFMPIYMKKNRPAVELIVVCDEDKISVMENLIFEHTTSIGIRKQAMERTVLKRYMDTLDTEYGVIEVKTVVLPNGKIRKYPEYESLKKLAEENGVTIREIKDSIVFNN